MKSARKFTVVLITAPDLKTARRLARLALEARLVACVNLVPGVESHYWWQGRLERSVEVLMVCKTSKALLPRLEALILKAHPYDTPEFIVLPLESGTARYLGWLADSVAKK